MARRNRLWGFNDSERALLVEATAEPPTLRALVARAERTAELPGLWTVRARKTELYDLYEAVEEFMDGQTSRASRFRLQNCGRGRTRRPW